MSSQVQHEWDKAAYHGKMLGLDRREFRRRRVGNCFPVSLDFFISFSLSHPDSSLGLLLRALTRIATPPSLGGVQTETRTETVSLPLIVVRHSDPHLPSIRSYPMPAQDAYGPFVLSPPLTSCEEAYIIFVSLSTRVNTFAADLETSTGDRSHVTGSRDSTLCHRHLTNRRQLHESPREFAPSTISRLLSLDRRFPTWRKHR